MLRSRSTVVTLGLATLILGGAVVACTGDDVADIAMGADAGSTDFDADTPPTGNDAGGDQDSGGNTEVDADTETDAATDEDAAAEEDGGPTVDASAGDGGVESDASAPPIVCNELKPTGTVDSTCTTTAPTFAGGTLVAGNYALESVTVYQKLCTKGFVVQEHSGDLSITKNKDGSFNASYVVTQREKDGIIKPVVSRFDRTLYPEGATKGSPATVVQSCPSALKTTLDYSSSTTKLTTTLSFSAPYGKGTAVYTWTHSTIIIVPPAP